MYEKVICLDCRERYEFMIDHHSHTRNLLVAKLRPEINSGLNDEYRVHLKVRSRQRTCSIQNPTAKKKGKRDIHV